MGKLKNSQYVIFIVAILLISLIVNVFLSVDNGNYRERIGKKTSDELETIIHGNETINQILANSIQSKCILKTDLVKLSSQYDQVYQGVWKLMDDYSYYKQSKRFTFKNDLNINCDVTNDAINKIKLYVNKFIESNANSNGDKIELKNNDLLNFKKMNDFSKELDSYFQTTIKKNSNDGTYDGMKDKIEVKNLWIDILNKIFNISNNYSSFEFKA
ncbi:hypothetical protein CSC2_44210 [Clostridium zeae]|uniref:Reticulocyte-binding protein n=1 Tax=Clostridium zeae TaxID=2759022 RepID=A0ABQ1EGG0_9CLOT|nr:hypothetical protein [Clostridium zeae]GFZ33895.1 hypothetical protein CSC2_44210 [Clostridium zeae]